MQPNGTTEFTAYYSMAHSFAKLVGCGDNMSGTELKHHGHVVARILDDRHVKVTNAKGLPVATEALKGIVSHVLKSGGVIVLDNDLSKPH
jgi:hypothetical protein